VEKKWFSLKYEGTGTVEVGRFDIRSDGTRGTHIYIDGKHVDGVTEFALTQSVGGPPMLMLLFNGDYNTGGE
jgi:hypothetical protein